MNKISPRTNDASAERGHVLSSFKFILTLLFGALTIYVLSLANYSIISSDSYYTGTISVSGHGEVVATPNIQKLSINIISETASTANSTSSTPKVGTSSAEYVLKVVALLKSKGIADSDIKMQSPQSMVVKLRGDNMDKSKSIANAVERISEKRIDVSLAEPEVENPALLKSRALEMALDDAKMNALKVSRSLGADLGKVISFDDNSYNGDSGYNNAYYGANNDQNYAPDMVTADVSVSYQSK